MQEVATETVATAGGGGLLGSLVTLAGLWLRSRLSGDKASQEITEIDKRLTRLETEMQAVKEGGKRNEDGIIEIRTTLNTMHITAVQAQIELATTLGRLEGELRARREKGPVTL